MRIKNKLLFIFLIFSLSVFFVGCNKTDKDIGTDSTTKDFSISIVVKDHDEEIFNKEIEVVSGKILLSILNENLKIEEENGFITSIEGRSQNPEENIYWLYFINGEFAEVGANVYEVKENDKIEFNLKNIDNE